MKTLVIAVIMLAIGLAVAAQTTREPMTFPLDCAGGDCLILKGAPQTSGMRGGSVKLKPGASVGSYSTNANEETLVILHGTGFLEFQGSGVVRTPLHEKMLAYIPPSTMHNVTNNGTETLEYVGLLHRRGRNEDG